MNENASSEVQPTILVVNLTRSTFMQKDIETLKQLGTVKVFQFKRKGVAKDFGILGQFINLFIWLQKNIKEADILFGWFLDYHLLLPAVYSKIYNKPLLVSLGGFDCANIPSLNYGVFNSWWRSKLAYFIVRQADLLLPVTEKLIWSENRYTEWPKERAFGLKTEIKNLQTPVQPLPTTYDEKKWPFGKNAKQRVVTAGNIFNKKNFYIKGIDYFLKTAPLLPQTTFLVVGIVPALKPWVENNYHLPDNVEISPPVKQEDLKAIFGSSKVYAQLSRTEGLPNVLAEAMLCGCIPVGSNIFGIPELVDQVGYLVDEPVSERIATEIKKALRDDESCRKKAREHIIKTFPKNDRKETLESIIRNFVNDERRRSRLRN